MIEAPCVRVGEALSIDALQLGTTGAADPGPGEIRVRIQASSLNYADYATVTGMVAGGPGRIPLSDGAGVVDAVGAGVAGWSEGDLALARFYPEWDGGAYSQAAASLVPGGTTDGFAARYVTRPASWFTRAPRGYSAAEAGTLGCAALTAWRGLFVETRLRPGDWVMVQGSGGVSIFGLQFAKAAGARVIATTSSAEKAARLKELGADHVINYREDAKWGQTAFELADGRGVDAILELGGGAQLAQSVAAVREAGYIGLIGVLSGWGGDVPTVALMFKNARIQGITVGNREQQLAMIEAIEAHGIRPVVSSRYPLERLGDAFREMTAQTHLGKIGIDI